jgi:hypothetical protein
MAISGELFNLIVPALSGDFAINSGMYNASPEVSGNIRHKTLHSRKFTNADLPIKIAVL